MTEYHKIETLFEREMFGKNKLIIGQWRNPTVEYLKDNVWQMTEKIDGTNIRIMWDGHNIYFMGRTNRAQIPPTLLSFLDSKFNTDVAEEVFEQMFGDKEVILFGEGYGAKIQNGGNYRPDQSFILFDVMINGNYQPRSTVEEVAKAFDCEIVPILFEGTLQEGIDFVKKHPKSTIGTAYMEGIVARPKVELQDRCGNRVIVKIKYKDFKDE